MLMYSASLECAPKPRTPKLSITGASLLSAAKAASVPPPRRHRHDQRLPDLGIDSLRMLSQGLLHRFQLEGRTPALERHRNLGIRNELVLDALTHLLLDPVVVGNAQHAYIGCGGRDRWNDIAIGASASDG